MGLQPGTVARRPHPHTRRRRRRARTALLVVLAVLSSGCGAFVEVRPLHPVTLPEPKRPTVIVDGDGRRLAELVGDGHARPITLDRVADVAVDAVIAVEDVRFRSHDGVDPRALGRALVRNLRERQVVEGGSTITQQLAKNTITGSARTLDRKVDEARIAWQLEQQYDKDEILIRYLNSVYFGSGAYGIESASREYFGRHADELDLPQAALLAGLLRSPARYDPRRHPSAARDRRDVVLNLMADHQLITGAQARAAAEAPLGVGAPRRRSWRAPYFVDHVLDELQHHPDFDVLGADPTARAQRIFGGDLRIETTLDSGWQKSAEQAVHATLSSRRDPDGALVAIDPATGAIRALIGGRDYFGNGSAARFNLATDARRQPGSTFKPIVLAAALGAGSTLDDTYDAPGAVRLPPVLGDAQPWTVHNYGDRAFGRIDLATATTWSVNVVYAQLIDAIGPEMVADLATRLGVASPLQPYRALALGAQDVTVLDMASVQATLAAGGVHRPAHAVLRITDGDEVLYERGAPRGRRVLDQTVALQVTAALREVVDRGTGVRAGADRPLAGKTGTTQDGADAWFAGYTPDMAAAVWMGFHRGRVPMVPPRTRATVEGGTWPAEAFSRFTLGALRDVPANDFVMRIPEVTTVELHTARELLDAYGLQLETVEEYSPSLPPGLVLAQSPEPGPRVALPQSFRVRLTVSTTTPPTVAVPDLLGLGVEQAQTQLRELGLVPHLVSACPGGQQTCTGVLERAGTVWEHVPAADTTVTVGAPVSLHVFPEQSEEFATSPLRSPDA